MNKIQLVKEAIEKAKKRESKMDEVAWSVPALSSLNIRHLMNNLGASSTNYLECGVHRGGLFCSTIRNNNLDIALAIDSFESDKVTGENIEAEFDKNSLNCVEGTDTAIFKTVSDTFSVDPNTMPIEIDLYLYDAAHDYDSQRNAMSWFLDNMADEFVVCVDDYDWPEVQEGTQHGIADAGVEILFEEVWKGNDHDNDGNWNGFYIAVLKKKK